MKTAGHCYRSPWERPALFPVTMKIAGTFAGHHQNHRHPRPDLAVICHHRVCQVLVTTFGNSHCRVGRVGTVPYCVMLESVHTVLTQSGTLRVPRYFFISFVYLISRNSGFPRFSILGKLWTPRFSISRKLQTPLDPCFLFLWILCFPVCLFFVILDMFLCTVFTPSPVTPFPQYVVISLSRTLRSPPCPALLLDSGPTQSLRS